jgi:hypothetical protein
MEVAQLAALRRRYPEAGAKSYLLTALAPGSALEVQDPFGGGEAAFRACFRHIRESVRPIVRALAAGDDGR